MSWFGDNLGFEKFQLGDWWRQIKDSPERLFIGAGDQFGTQMWNKILGKDWDPMVNYAGGPSGATYNRADQAGINTGPARGAHKVADVIAGSIGLMNAGSALQGLGGAGQAGSTQMGGGAQEAFRGLEYGGSGGYGGGFSGYTGYGAGGTGVPSSVNMANAGGTMSTAGGMSNLFNKQNLSTLNQGLDTAQGFQGLFGGDNQQPPPPPQFGGGRDPIGEMLRQQQEIEILRRQRRGLLGG